MKIAILRAHPTRSQLHALYIVTGNFISIKSANVRSYAGLFTGEYSDIYIWAEYAEYTYGIYRRIYTYIHARMKFTYNSSDKRYNWPEMLRHHHINTTQ